MTIKSKIIKLEKVLKPNIPAVLIGHSESEVRQMLDEYNDKNPHGPSPVVLLVSKINKPPNSGLGEF